MSDAVLDRATAKASFSEVIDRVGLRRPQTITGAGRQCPQWFPVPLPESGSARNEAGAR